MRIYICYTQHDLDHVRPIHSGLANLGQKVFFDKDSIPAGEDWERLLEKEIKSSDAVVLLWSAAAASSPWVMHELSKALLHEKLVVPCMVDNEPLPTLIKNIQALKWDGTESAMLKLYDSLGLNPTESDGQGGPQTLRESLDLYRQKIGKYFGTLRPLGRAADAPIQELYLPLYLKSAQAQPGVADRIPAASLLDKHETRAVILGRPGTGKSTTLRYLGYTAARSKTSFPVLLRIAELMGTNDTVLDYVTSQLKGLIG